MPKIYLSPSFQDHNIGVDNFGTEERRCNEIADVIERELKKNNKFIVIRNNPNMSLSEIIADSNKNNPDIHFSIHTNAGINTARGCEVYAYKKGTEGDKLAQIVYRRLSTITPSEDRGVKYNSLAETRQTKGIAVLTEVAFHSNKEDAEWIINNIELIGTELAKALYEYYHIEYDAKNINNTTVQQIIPQTNKYTFENFVKDVQTTCGLKGKDIDGIAGPKTIGSTITISKTINKKHPVVKVVQKYLISIGYNLSKYGADGDFGDETEKAVKQYQKDKGLKVIDGIITAKANTWKKLLRLV